MASDMFIKIEGIKGESADSKHKDEIDILGWNWGLSQSGSMHSGSGGGAGRVNVQDISFTKYVDKATANLIKFCSTGDHLKKATISVRKAGEPLEYIKLILEEVIITSVSMGGADGQEMLTENVTINFAKYKVEYVPQSNDGAKGAAVEAAFNIRQNKATG